MKTVWVVTEYDVLLECTFIYGIYETKKLSNKRKPKNKSDCQYYVKEHEVESERKEKQ